MRSASTPYQILIIGNPANAAATPGAAVAEHHRRSGLQRQWHAGAGPHHRHGRGRRLGQHHRFLCDQQRDDPGTSRRRRRRGGGRGILFRHAALRDHARGARVLLLGGRRTDPVRYRGRPARDAGRSPEAGLRRPGRRQRYVPRIHAGLGRHHGIQRIAEYHDQRMPERSQLSEFLRHLGCDAACGGDRRIDAAGEPRRHADADLQLLARRAHCR